MNQQRQNELYHELIRWVFEQCRSREQLFYVLCERIGMTQEELHDSGIRELDRFFQMKIKEEVDESVEACTMSLPDFIGSVSRMIDGEDKTAVLNWLLFAWHMTETESEDRFALEKTLRNLYLPLCYVQNNFSSDILQQSLNLHLLGNEIIFGAMLFAAGYGKDEVHQLADDGVLEDGYIPIKENEKEALSIVSIAGRGDCLLIVENEKTDRIRECIEKAASFAVAHGQNMETVLIHPNVTGMHVRKVDDPKLLHAIKTACAVSSAFASIVVYEPENQKVAQYQTKEISPEQRAFPFCCMTL